MTNYIYDRKDARKLSVKNAILNKNDKSNNERFIRINKNQTNEDRVLGIVKIFIILIKCIFFSLVNIVYACYR